MVADEPFDMNGTDLAPGPYDYLLASLAACKAMTVRMYAERKGWPLEGMTINVSHEKVKASQSDLVQATSGFADIFDCEMSFQGDLDEAQRTRLLEISAKCPVHRSLISENVIVSKEI